MAVCGQDLYFSAHNLANGQEPWRLANAVLLQEAGGEERETVLEELEALESAAPAIKIYPNPSSDFASVELTKTGKSSTLSVLATSGQLARSIQIPEGETQVQVDVQDLPKGVYLVRWVQSDEQVVVKKLIVQ